MTRINVTRATLPPLEEYVAKLQLIWATGHITNNGDLLLELERDLKAYLGVRHLFLTANGTLALQIALRAAGVSGEVITTPFSYVATVNALLWERCTPVFVDIDPHNLCIDPNKIEAAITPATRAILPVHVYGNPCDVASIEAIARKHQIKVVYDAAHAFGTRLDGQSPVVHGDLSILSFHATKLFHTVEGGAVVTNDDDLAEQVRLMRAFGHLDDEYSLVGINAKNSELHAAMGLCLLPRITEIIAARCVATEYYDRLLTDTRVLRPRAIQTTFESNYSYYPIVLPNERVLMNIKNALQVRNIYPRRYFYPALNRLPFLQNAASCPVAEDFANRVLCLPLFGGIDPAVQEAIATVVLQALK